MLLWILRTNSAKKVSVTQLLPPPMRRFGQAQFLPPLALALTFVAWLGLAPWRPILAGDDFGFYDSVVRTLLEGRPIVSDWLAPATVGLTLPATMLTWLVGDLWFGSMLTMGLFGALGLVALWGVLRGLALPPARIALTLLILGFCPIYLGKWTRFESCLPSVSLLLTALALMVRVFSPQANAAPFGWRYSLVAGFCIAWAIAIRQNHVVMILACILGLLVLPALRQRVRLLITWTLPAALLFIAIRFGVPLSFAQRTATLDLVSAQFSVVSYGVALLRAVGFSAGMALLLVLLIAPQTIFRMVRHMSRRDWIIGLISSGLLLFYATTQRTLAWFSPNTDILALQLVHPLLWIAIVLIGSLCWWPVVTSPLRSITPWIGGVLLLMAIGYLLLVAAWGYWEYYLLEPIVLLMLLLLIPTTDDTNRSTTHVGQPARPYRFAQQAWFMLIVIYVLLAWNMQWMSNDMQVTQLQVVEHAFRDRIAIPADIEQAPFGLLGWSLFPQQVLRWPAKHQGFSLAFWELQSRNPTVSFRWGCADRTLDPSHDQLLRSGIVRVGWQPQCWSLVKHTGTVQATTLITDHRYLPLTTVEWQQFLAQNR